MCKQKRYLNRRQSNDSMRVSLMSGNAAKISNDVLQKQISHNFCIIIRSSIILFNTKGQLNQETKLCKSGTMHVCLKSSSVQRQLQSTYQVLYKNQHTRRFIQIKEHHDCEYIVLPKAPSNSPNSGNLQLSSP